MNDLLRPVLTRWRFFALLAAAAMLGAAHAFQHFGGLAPCTLCLRQREVYWVAGTLAAVSMAVVRLPGGPRWRAPSDLLLGAIFLAGVALAVWHAGAEWKFWPGPAACASSGASVSPAAMDSLLLGAKAKAPSCDQAAWVFGGLSMAGWNALISLGLAALSLQAALYERSRR
ncbi:disulfide bond formation protein B [Phenylobacterium sp.]|uniref:disulfide bond formation protein B n=1 Tax=Phenylobacterium sp. TaxID=1871053 RepID=UPI0027371396|nr:disulfide bond formation protein B [Phenylobacterium sp.]MDP3658591.1 disulfide bond formation protein B [Phenylobacterium sp.]